MLELNCNMKKAFKPTTILRNHFKNTEPTAQEVHLESRYPSKIFYNKPTKKKTVKEKVRSNQE